MTTSSSEALEGGYSAKPGALINAQLIPDSNIVGADTQLLVKFKSANVIPKNGKMHIEINEDWNRGTNGVGLPYFSSLSCNSLKVGNNAPRAGSYFCVFLENRV